MAIKNIKIIEPENSNVWEFKQDHTIFDHVSQEIIDQLSLGIIGIIFFLIFLLIYVLYKRFKN